MQLFLSLLVLVLVTVVQAGPTSPWQDLFVFDCSGHIRLFPSNPILHVHINASIARFGYPRVAQEFHDRTKCHCNDLTEDEITQSFSPNFFAVLKALERQSDDATNRDLCNDGFRHSIDELGSYWGINLPSSCTSASYAAGNACTGEFAVPRFDASFQLAIQRCPQGLYLHPSTASAYAHVEIYMLIMNDIFLLL